MSANVKIIKFTEDDQNDSERIIHAAIYARYSSTGNSEYSAEEQITRIRFRVDSNQAKSRKYPNAKVVIKEGWVVKDEAKTGRVTRDGYELVKSGIRANSFDMLLMDDISRMSRDMGSTIDLYELLEFSGVEGYSIADNISTVDPNSRDLFIFKGYANEHQSKATSKNTIRGLEIRVLGGYSTGNNPYGYYSTPTQVTHVKGIEKPSHFQIKIKQDEAVIIEKIWNLFASGYGCHSIASLLNEQLIPAPQRNKKGSTHNKWSEKTVWNVLNQEKYIGLWKYRTTKVVKNPNTDKLTQKERSKEEWLVTEREDLRIIPKELELKVKNRRVDIGANKTSSSKSNFGSRGNTPKHLFIGSMKCGECAGNFILVGGKGGGYLGCFNAHRETPTPCNNKKTVKMSLVEWHLIDELRQQIDNPQTYQYLAKRYNELMNKRHGELPKRLAQVEEILLEVEKEVQNYSKFIKDGYSSELVARNLATSESKLKTLVAERDHLRSQVESRVYVTPQAIKKRLVNLDEILGKRTIEANSILKMLFPEKITMTPLERNKSKVYEASGALNLYCLTRFKKCVNGNERFNNYEVGVPQVQDFETNQSSRFSKYEIGVPQRHDVELSGLGYIEFKRLIIKGNQ